MIQINGTFLNVYPPAFGQKPGVDLAELLFAPQTQLPAAGVIPPARPPYRIEWEPGVLRWPSGASRFSVGQYIVSDAEVSAIWPSGFSSAQVTLTLVSTDAPTQTCTFKLYPLALLPLGLDRSATVPSPRSSGLYLLVLVDERYFLQTQSPTWTITDGTTTYAQLDTSLTSFFTVSYSGDSVPSAYLKPSSNLAASALASQGVIQWAAPLVDLIGQASGRRFISTPSGTFKLENWATATTQNATNLANASQYRHPLGGLVAFPPATESTTGLYVVPTSITCTYPEQTSSVETTPFTSTNTFASLKTAAGYLSGDVAVTEGTLNVGMGLWSDGTNHAALTSHAQQWATDWYGWLRGTTLQTYSGVVNWIPTGFDDCVIWTVNSEEVSTRVDRGLLNPRPNTPIQGRSTVAPLGPVFPTGATFNGPVYFNNSTTTWTNETLTYQTGSISNYNDTSSVNFKNTSNQTFKNTSTLDFQDSATAVFKTGTSLTFISGSTLFISGNLNFPSFTPTYVVFVDGSSNLTVDVSFRFDVTNVILRLVNPDGAPAILKLIKNPVNPPAAGMIPGRIDFVAQLPQNGTEKVISYIRGNYQGPTGTEQTGWVEMAGYNAGTENIGFRIKETGNVQFPKANSNNYGLYLTDGTGTLQQLASPGAANTVLISGGSSTNPTWGTVPAPPLTFTEIGIGSSSNLLTGDSTFTFVTTGTNKTQQIYPTGTAGTPTIQLYADNGGSNWSAGTSYGAIQFGGRFAGTPLGASAALTAFAGGASDTASVFTISGNATNAIEVRGTGKVKVSSLSASSTVGTDSNSNLTTPAPSFVAAGGSHASGIVPDPGATAHTNFPFYLGDDAAFHAMGGQLFGKKFVAADESTTSVTFTDLTTADSVAFTTDRTEDLVVVYYANIYNATTTNGCSNAVFLDGVQQSSSNNMDAGYPGAGVPCGYSGIHVITGVAPGSHTVKVQHLSSGGVPHWRQRLLLVMRG